MIIDKPEIGNRLKKCRNVKKITQEQLAERIGLEPKSYSNIERGYRLFSVEILLKLMEVLEVSADYILTGRINKETPVTGILNALDHEDAARLEMMIQLFYESVKSYKSS